MTFVQIIAVVAIVYYVVLVATHTIREYKRDERIRQARMALARAARRY